MPFGNSFFTRAATLGAVSGLRRPVVDFLISVIEVDALDQVHRVEHVALALAHLVAVRVVHQAVDVDVAERHLAGEVQRHHDHPGDPEEDDVVAGDQHVGGQEQVLLDRLGRPAEGRERELRGRVPGVEHVFVARELAAVAGGRGLRSRLVFAARDEQLAAAAVPGRDLVAPPELARDAPVLDVLHPLVPGVDPLRRHEAHVTAARRHASRGRRSTRRRRRAWSWP